MQYFRVDQVRSKTCPVPIRICSNGCFIFPGIWTEKASRISPAMAMENNDVLKNGCMLWLLQVYVFRITCECWGQKADNIKMGGGVENYSNLDDVQKGCRRKGNGAQPSKPTMVQGAYHAVCDNDHYYLGIMKHLDVCYLRISQKIQTRSLSSRWNRTR